MANDNIAVNQELPANALNLNNRQQADPKGLPVNLARVGRSIAISALVAALMPLPEVLTSQIIYFRCAFYTALLVLFFFGLGMIVLSWLVSDDPVYYGIAGRAVMRASQIMLVFSGALDQLLNIN